MTTAILAPRTLLFLPASNPRAIEKARGLAVDMVVLDLEDAVRAEDKDSARAAAREVAFEGKLTAIRLNTQDSPHFAADLAAARESRADFIVVPKVEAPLQLDLAKPLLAMIETAPGVLAAPQIAAGSAGLAGLIAGTNDLSYSLRLPAGAGRGPIETSLQLIVLAARAHGLWAFDGVYNKLEDTEGLETECRHGRNLGFDGKSLIHPNQVDIARCAFSPGDAELAKARALIEAATGGAERYGDEMIEDMHVEQARALLNRAT
jgi:(3S)-malyl-CoA thioesterase